MSDASNQYDIEAILNVVKLTEDSSYQADNFGTWKASDQTIQFSNSKANIEHAIRNLQFPDVQAGSASFDYDIYFDDQNRALITISHDGLNTLPVQDFHFTTQLMLAINDELSSSGFTGNILYSGQGSGGMFANLMSIGSETLPNYSDANSIVFNALNLQYDDVVHFFEYGRLHSGDLRHSSEVAGLADQWNSGDIILN